MKTQRQLSRLLFGLALLSFPGLAVTVTDHMLTKAVNTSGGCIVPTPATSFLTTDQSVWLWFNVTGANAGDVASATWYSPNGAAYSSTTWNPLASAGTWCYWSSISVVGYPPASSPGNWSVRVSWNGSALFSLNFTILAPAVLSISTGGVVNAASYASGAAVAPGSIASAFGSFLLTSPAGAANMPLPSGFRPRCDPGPSIQAGGRLEPSHAGQHRCAHLLHRSGSREQPAGERRTGSEQSTRSDDNHSNGDDRRRARSSSLLRARSGIRG